MIRTVLHDVGPIPRVSSELLRLVAEDKIDGSFFVVGLGLLGLSLFVSTFFRFSLFENGFIFFLVIFLRMDLYNLLHLII